MHPVWLCRWQRLFVKNDQRFTRTSGGMLSMPAYSAYEFVVIVRSNELGLS
jgi:hypothetical protein